LAVVVHRNTLKSTVAKKNMLLLLLEEEEREVNKHVDCPLKQDESHSSDLVLFLNGMLFFSEEEVSHSAVSHIESSRF
jgi:hypothetical protein